MHYSLASFIHRLSRLTLQDIGAALNSFIHEVKSFIYEIMSNLSTINYAHAFLFIIVTIGLFMLWLWVKDHNVKDEFVKGQGLIK